MSTREALARLVWAEIAASGQRQYEVARIVGISEKHLSEIVNGHVGANPDMVDRILSTCGRRLVISTEVITGPLEHICPDCRVERADYEGPGGAHLPECPNCGSTAAPRRAD